MDYSKIRIIDFLELYKDINEKDKIALYVFYDEENSIKCNLENFRIKLKGMEYKYCSTIKLNKNKIIINIEY
jgi:hypothetical protein